MARPQITPGRAPRPMQIVLTAFRRKRAFMGRNLIRWSCLVLVLGLAQAIAPASDPTPPRPRNDADKPMHSEGSHEGDGVAARADIKPSASSDHQGGILRPEIDGPWWTVAHSPDLGALSGPDQQPVDFAVWQAADGPGRSVRASATRSAAAARGCSTVGKAGG